MHHPTTQPPATSRGLEPRPPRKTIWIPFAFVLAFVLGAGVGAWADKKVEVDPSYYRDKAPEQAAASLLEVARGYVEEDGSWEKIAIAQIYYLSGDTAQAEALFDSIRKKDASDWMRIGRVYYRAGDWEKSRTAFDRVVELKPKDEDWLAEIGMYYNLQGDRATAESYFDRAFENDPKNFYNTLKVAGSYLGVEER